MLTSNVVGPISPSDWFMLGEIRRSINDMLSVSPFRYELAIKAENRCYNKILKKYK